MEGSGVVGHVPWSHTEPMRRRRWGDQLDRSPMFFDRNGARTFGFAAELLYAFMHDAGMRYRDLAAASGVSRGRIECFARGSAQPNEAQVVALARALGVEPWMLCWA